MNHFYDRKGGRVLKLEFFNVLKKENDKYVYHTACHRAASFSHAYTLAIAFTSFDSLLWIIRRHLKIMPVCLFRSNIDTVLPNERNFSLKWKGH